MISGMQTELKNLKTQYDIKKSIIPHCEELWYMTILAKTTQGFVCSIRFMLNMAQIDKLDKLQSHFEHSGKIENNLKRNNYEQIFKI
jgi:hypothetical protein